MTTVQARRFLTEEQALTRDSELEDDLATQIALYAAKQPNPLSLGTVLEMMTPWPLARFIYKELPIRYAERIRAIEALPAWETIPDLVEVHRRHVDTFKDIVTSGRFPRKSSLGDPDLLYSFNEIIRAAAMMQGDVQLLTARSMHALHQQHPELYTVDFIDKWLDDFLLNWIGTDMLLAHYLACVHGTPTGIINPNCDVGAVCRDVAFTMQRRCHELMGRVPVVQVLSRSALDEDRRAPSFSYIPSFLNYILIEILKNSCRATLESTEDEVKIQKRPITILVCADERRVAIRISDLARGIPFDVGAHVWSYMYSTERRQGKDPSYGVGLPLSRLYARYLGGSLDLVSWPGYGTEVCLFLPRLTSEQVEVVPDQDNIGWTRERVARLVVDNPKGDEEFTEFVDWVFGRHKHLV